MESLAVATVPYQFQTIFGRTPNMPLTATARAFSSNLWPHTNYAMRKLLHKQFQAIFGPTPNTLRAWVSCEWRLQVVGRAYQRVADVRADDDALEEPHRSNCAYRSEHSALFNAVSILTIYLN